LINENFPGLSYRNITGLCKIATITEIMNKGWSLNPGIYVGTQIKKKDGDFDFTHLKSLDDKLAVLNIRAIELEERIKKNTIKLLEKQHE